MLRKPDLYNKATTLRRKGLSYNEILKFIHVGQGTISRWCSQIPLTEEQKERLLEKKRNTPLIQRLRKQAIQSKKEAKVWAVEQTNKIFNNDKLLFIVGIVLYWAEGTKSGVGGGVEFTNTDPQIIKIMMKFFRKILDVPNNKFRIIVRIGDKGDVGRAEKYWSTITKVSQRNFRRPEILKLSKNSKSLKKYPYGMCRITIHNVLARRKMLALIAEFSKKFLEEKKYKKKTGILNKINSVPVAQWIRAEAS